MAKGKGKKVVSEKKVQPHYPIKTSDECARCGIKCPTSLRYIENLHVTGKGNGVVCKHIGQGV